MSDLNLEQQKNAVDRIVESLSPQEQEQLLRWAQELETVRNSQLTVLRKGKKALAITRQNQALAPVVKSLLRELRRIGWDERTWIGRLGISGSILGFLALNTATGGFAAFGTAVAVPLWLVVGGGGLLLGLLIETLKKKKAAKNRRGGS
jgi:hypothetical protein